MLTNLLDIGNGISGISNKISLSAPVNLNLAIWCLAVGEQLITTLNLGGYMPTSSLIFNISFKLPPLTKKSISLS